ncbi:MAG: Uncharacterised protein [Prochlorococcus marinus str. MIT 9313]|nr:MAG: Uncharacterised protein [Prochlorococcus marinus str. MIT 9313]
MEIKTARCPEESENAQEQAKITHTVDDKSLLSCMGGTISVVPEAHQEIGAHPYQLPKHVDFEKVWADDQAQHRAAE